MADYKLSGLSTRSFEQLIQALAAKVIGPNVVIFGDGRDGGREATFEGSIPYPTKQNSWNGYGVVQAKFKQRPQDSKSDGEWALQQLRAELEDFANPEKKRRQPDYYIFATNVVLTPFPGKGSKDLAADVIKEFKDRVPLKDYDIWDYDKICSFLDDNEEIRHSYAAWVTPGDVLSQVINRINLERPDFDKTLTRYLQEELLTDQYANLERARHASDNPIPIARVFVDMPVSDRYAVEPPDEKTEDGKLPPGFINTVLRVAASRLDHQSLTTIPFDIQKSLLHIPEEYGRYVLIGGPGQGKTTAGQFICQLFRAAILKEKPLSSFEPDVQRTLEITTTQCEHENFDLPGARRFPVRIVLSEFAKQLAQSGEEKISLLSYIVGQISKRTDQTISLNDFRLWLGSYPWLVILDGLDEVPLSSNRDEVLKAIRSFRIEARECNADVLIIATTRPQGYSDDFSSEQFRHVYLTPLSITRALHYGRRLVEARYPKDSDRREKILSRLERASQQEATARLMRSPLQVTIMTTLVDRMGQPPQERWNLFHDYYNVIYQREMEREIPAANILREYRKDVEVIHSYVGLLLQVESERTGRTDARLSSTDFARVVEARLKDRGHEGAELNNLRDEIIKAAAYRLVFLVGLEAEQVGFEIRSLQEFMAAEGLMSGGDEHVTKRLHNIAPIANWRNVFLFAASRCLAEREHLLDTVQSICLTLNDDPADEIARATLSGSQLALDLLEDTPIPQHPKYARNLARIAMRLLDQSPNNQHRKLADLYHTSLSSIYREEIERRLKLIDFPRSLGAWACLIHLVELDVEWAAQMGEELWPEKLDDEIKLVELSARLRGVKLLGSKLITIIPRHSPEKLRRVFMGWGKFFYNYVAEANWLKSALSAIDPFYRDFTTIPLFKSDGLEDVLVTRFYFLKKEGNQLLTPLRSMPQPYHAGWTPYVAASLFCEHPSSETLTSALRMIAFDKNIFSQVRRAPALPWPILACLAFAKEKTDLAELIDRIEAGELGDIGDWIEAEERWKEQGIAGEDFKGMSDDRWPFDKQIVESGFPFDLSSWILSYLYRRIAVLKKLLDLHSQLDPSRIRNHLAYLIIWIFSGLIEYPEDWSQVSIEVPYQTLIEDVSETDNYFYLSVLNKVKWQEENIESWLASFDKLGKHPFLLEYLIDKDTINYLLEYLVPAFCQNPDLSGVLRIISILRLSGGTTDATIPLTLLNDDFYENILIKEAALTIRLLQRDWTQTDVHEIANRVARLISKRKDFTDTLETVIQKLPADSVTDALLLELRQVLSGMDWNAAGKVMDALNESMKRRLSRLAEDRTWEELKLPKGLKASIHE